MIFDMDTSTVLTLFVSFLLFIFAVRIIYPRVRDYLNKRKILDQLESNYENLRSARKDIVFHYYWSKDRGDWKESEQHERHCEEVD